MTSDELNVLGLRVKPLTFIEDEGLFVASGLDGRYSYVLGEWYCGPDRVYRNDRWSDEFEAALNEMHAASIAAALEGEPT